MKVDRKPDKHEVAVVEPSLEWTSETTRKRKQSLVTYRRRCRSCRSNRYYRVSKLRTRSLNHNAYESLIHDFITSSPALSPSLHIASHSFPSCLSSSLSPSAVNPSLETRTMERPRAKRPSAERSNHHNGSGVHVMKSCPRKSFETLHA